MSVTGPMSVGIVGGGWRAEYYLRIAAALPGVFRISGVLVRTAASAQRMESVWSVPTFTDVDTFLRAGDHDYVVVSVPRTEAPHLARRIVATVPVLLETPPAEDLDGLEALYGDLRSAPVQVAEQYRFQPQHRARLVLAHSGAIGTVTRARVSVAHDYHGVSLLRSALSIGFDPLTISGEEFVENVVASRGRDSWAPRLGEHAATLVSARLELPEKLGQYEFQGDQYVSPTRSRHISIHGSSGEVWDDQVHLVQSAGRAVHLEVTREMMGADGDLEGMFLRSISAGERLLYSNPFGAARLNDDEVAVAHVMAGMADYVRSGVPFYGLADASHDHYLSLCIAESIAQGTRIHTSERPWSTEESLAAITPATLPG